MKITDHIHALKIPFKISERFVYVYLLYGKQIYLIDSGLSSSVDMIFDYLKKTGRHPREISLLIQTHSHSDHIGGSPAIKRSSECRVAAHIAEKSWIEDVDLQFKERPTANFRAFVEGSVEVEMELRGGEELDFDNGLTLKIIHTPGHSMGSVSLWFPEDGALFSGDAIPAVGDLPIYEDVLTSIRSIRKLRAIKGLKVLFSSWLDPQHGERAYEAMDDALGHIQGIHEVVRKEAASFDSSDSLALCSRVLKILGIPEVPNTITTIKAHLKEIEHQNLLQV